MKEKEIFYFKSKEEIDEILKEQSKELRKAFELNPISDKELEEPRQYIESKKYEEGLTIEEYAKLLNHIEKHNSRKYL